jgi:hypothetical protein
MIAITIISSRSEKPQRRIVGRTKDNGGGWVGICAQQAIRRILAGAGATL